jgi:hemoglobin
VSAVPGRPAIAERPDTSDRPDITGLVTEFYRRAFAGEVLGPLFVDVAPVDLSAHLPIMGDFGDTVLLRAGVYHRDALRPHLALAAEVELTDAHFARRLALCTATVDERHMGPGAELAKTRGARIAGSIRRRLHDARASVSTTIPSRHPPGRPL